MDRSLRRAIISHCKCIRFVVFFRSICFAGMEFLRTIRPGRKQEKSGPEATDEKCRQDKKAVGFLYTL